MFNLKERIVKPEFLDVLAEDHPDALKNRRDIYLFNRLMGNYRWIRRRLIEHIKGGVRVLEIGAGLGDLGKDLSRKMNTEGLNYDGLDLHSRPLDWPNSWGWLQQDINDIQGFGEYDIVVANLILHQFEDDQLALIGKALETGVRVLIFCEPLRGWGPMLGLFASNLLGINYVSRHDGRVSIEAGFRGKELLTLLGLDLTAWSVRSSTTLLGAYRIVAVRK